MEFGIMFFSSVQPDDGDDRYRLLLDATRFADRNGFRSVWVPERHFHPFGGLFPNPSVAAAALAMISNQLELRAGSLVSPLHDTIRIAENWSMVDNLSGGRVGISFGSGWNSEDFVFFPENFENRHEILRQQIDDVRALWRGETIRRRTPTGREIDVSIFPRPTRSELPFWVTSSGNVRTFRAAGEIGANVLTHLIGQSIGELADKITAYREAREAAGFDPASGRVTLMLHTFMGDDLEEVRRRVHDPFCRYLASAISLEQMAAQGAGVVSGGHQIDSHDISAETMQELLEITFERYFRDGSLMGTEATCKRLLWQVAETGVDEIACLIDFLDDPAAVLASLRHVVGLVDAFSSRTLEAAVQSSLADFLDPLD